MWGIDHATAVTSMPTPTAETVNGYATDGNPATGLAATVLPSDCLNILIKELQNVLAAAGVIQDKTQFNQLLTAIQTLPRATRVVTASGAVTVTATDDVVIVKKGTGAATTVNLPASPATGRRYTIKDGKGDAATNNITITPAAGTIDGASTLVISANYGKSTLLYNGAEWGAI